MSHSGRASPLTVRRRAARRRGRQRVRRQRRQRRPRAAAASARSRCGSATSCRSPATSPPTGRTSIAPSSSASTCRTPRCKQAGQLEATVKLVGSEDGQTQASASVEAATKLVKSNKANVIIGEMASSATIPMAQSVTIPNQHRPDLADLERAADHRRSRTTATSGGRIHRTRCRARCSRRRRSRRSARARRSTSAPATTPSARRCCSSS